MMFGRRRPSVAPTSADETERPNRGVDFAWRTHGAITDWTAKVDTKAAIVLSLGGVLLGFFVTLSGSNRVLANLQGWRLAVEWVGLAMVAIAVLCAGLVVAPRLNRRQSKKIWREHIVYFGHLRHWDPKDLQRELNGLTAERELDVLSRQLVTTSKIAWYKHSLLQFSIAGLIIGVLLVTLSVAWP